MRLQNITSANTKQIGTGDGTRQYERTFFDLGIACIGPGDSGPFGTPEATAWFELYDEGVQRVTTMSRLEPGSWLIARKGLRTIVGVGQVTSHIQWNAILEDIEGWDLQHHVTVDWYRPIGGANRIVFDRNLLPQRTLSACNSPEVYARIAETDFERVLPIRSEESLRPAKSIGVNDLSRTFMDLGLRSQDSDNVAATIEHIIRLTQWYQDNDRKVRENEIRAFLVVPFLIALGWSEQRMKLEYHGIDVALFDRPFQGDYDSAPQVIVEAKQFGNGLAFTHEQINSYADAFPDCQRLVATNGYRYVYVERQNGVITKRGYFNLLRLRDRNALYLDTMTPAETMVALSRLQ